MKRKIMIHYDKYKFLRLRIKQYGIDATLLYLNKTLPDMVRSTGGTIRYHPEDYTREELENIMKVKI